MLISGLHRHMHTRTLHTHTDMHEALNHPQQLHSLSLSVPGTGWVQSPALLGVQLTSLLPLWLSSQNIVSLVFFLLYFPLSHACYCNLIYHVEH